MQNPLEFYVHINNFVNYIDPLQTPLNIMDYFVWIHDI